MSKKISIIIPCYNEEITILSVIQEIRSILPESMIYVFNNNSTDKTRNLVSDYIEQLGGGDTSNFLMYSKKARAM